MIVIETQTSAQREISHPDQVLRVGGLLAVLRVVLKVKYWRRVPVEEARLANAVGDDVVVELLAYRRKGCLAAGFPFMAPQVARQAAVEITFAKSAVLI